MSSSGTAGTTSDGWLLTVGEVGDCEDVGRGDVEGRGLAVGEVGAADAVGLGLDEGESPASDG